MVQEYSENMVGPSETLERPHVLESTPQNDTIPLNEHTPPAENDQAVPAAEMETKPKKSRRRYRKPSASKESGAKFELSKNERRKKDFVGLKWGGHAETTPYSLPVTAQLLRNNPLDAEISKDVLGSIGKHRPKKSPASASAVTVTATTPEAKAATNWGKLENMLEERKEVAKPVSAESVTRSWFEMPYVPLTDEQKRDIRVIENRQHLNPKRFYKSSGSGLKKGELPDQVQFGVIIAAPHDFLSSRLSKRERRRTITEEIMADDKVMAFTQRRNKTIQKHATRKRRVIDPAAKRKRR